MPRHAPPAEPRRASSILIGLAALTGMLTLVIAVPIVLATAWQALGPPIPSPRELTGPDDGTVFVRALCLVAWAAWASFTWAALAEILAQWRGWRLPALGWQQRLAADLIAAVIVLFASPTVVSSVAAPVSVPAATAHPLPAGGQSPADVGPRQQSGRAAYVEHHVQPGEQLPALAERYLGDKYRWQTIAAATYGLPQPDGRTLRPGDTRLYPGWTVRIPTTSTASASGTVLTSSTVLTSGALTSGTAPARPSPAQTAPAAEQTPAEPGPRTVEYEVREGDWVWHIADRFLGDPDRYPDIAALNPQLARKYGTAFPDHIEPGDTLRLPAETRDRGARPHATGTTHSATAAPTPTTPSRPAGTDGPPSNAGTTPPAPPATTPPMATTSPTRNEPTTPATSGTISGQVTAPATTVPPASAPTTATSTPTPAPHAATPTADPIAQPANSHHGINVGDRGWVTTDLAAAVAALAALIWIQRRRRYRPRPLSRGPRADPDLAPLPAAVTALHAAHPTAAITDQPTAEDRTTIEDDMDDPEPHARLAATVTHASLGTGATGQTLRLADLPALGVGWTGPGAPDAARGLIVSILSSGGPWSPAAEATLVTTSPALTDLLPDVDARTADPLRLHVADTTEQALSELERQLLRRAREAADPDPGMGVPLDGDDSEAEQRVPAPLVLLADAPTAGTATRLAAILTVGSRLGITAVLLGDWPPGDTWHLAPDGTVTDADGGQAVGAGQRVNALDPTAATEILHALREAHPTDDPNQLAARTPPPPLPASPPPAPALPRVSPAATPADHVARLPGNGLLPAHRPPEPTTPPGQRADAGTGPRLQLRVLGAPLVRVSDGDRVSDLRIRRSDGLQLLVYFTVEPAGATSDQLMALLWPDSRPRHSRGRFHTTLSELRHTLIDALGNDVIRRTEDRYHLDPTRVDADLWDLAAAIDHAATAVDGAHHAALHDVVHRYTGPVAEGHTWLWLDPYRETVRRHVLDAYTALAEAEPDPNAALAIIQDAIRVDPYNENLYQRAMHLHAQLGSPDGIHRTLRTITKRLGELEIPLSPRTQQTASHLLERLATRERLRHPAT